MTSAPRCPTCGAELTSLFRGPEMVVCAHCRAVVVLTSGVPSAHGQLGPLLARPTPFSLGMTLPEGGRAYTLVGRARYAYDGGEWDEWTLRAEDGAEARLADDEGDLVWFASLEILAPTTLPATRPGGAAQVGALTVRVAERGRASLVGAEGALTRALDPSGFAYIDGHADGGLVSVRAYPARTEIYRGAPYRHGPRSEGWG